jgi:hypothetical protein
MYNEDIQEESETEQLTIMEEEELCRDWQWWLW